MNEILKKIIELSDCEWIQERWKPKRGDWYYWKSENCDEILELTDFIDENSNYVEWVVSGTDDKIWLPVGFNPETGNWQIDGLLFEKLGYKNWDKLTTDFTFWIWDNKEPDDELTESDLLLKLRWLHELIEEEA